jgi:hypothetical protein
MRPAFRRAAAHDTRTGELAGLSGHDGALTRAMIVIVTVEDHPVAGAPCSNGAP